MLTTAIMLVIWAVTGLMLPGGSRSIAGGDATPIPAGSDNADRTPMVLVSAGCFMMGSEDGDDDEKPVHEACLSDFWIGQTEVTNAQYAVCVAAGGCSLPHDQTYYDDPAYADHPVVYVDWEQANEYAAWMGCSLPTEAQWEYAARGPEGWGYPWGNEFDGTRLDFCDANCTYAWRDTDYDDGHAGTAPVGSYEGGVSWVGALDMAGNVWEWVADWYGEDYYATLEHGVSNPTGPAFGAGRVVRGGSWASYRGYTRASSRDWDSPHLRFIVVGFRVACAPPIS